MNSPVYEVLAQAFVAEGVDTLFTLMGNGNMYWSNAMAQSHGVRTIHARHEHCAVAMAEGYARITDRIGVASTTCGPGFTQIMTALTVATRARIPLVVFTGEAPANAPWHVHSIDQGPLTLATGAHFVPIRLMDRVLNDVREAFYVARTERRPVVVSVPEDFQRETYPFIADYSPSTDIVPTSQRPLPDPQIIDKIADLVARSSKPIVLAGRGATRAGAGASLRALAEQCGALLATTLFAKGLFNGDPYDIGIAGAYASNLAREMFAEADLVIGVGASLGYYTTEGGYLYPNASVVQIDAAPKGLWQGQRVADIHLQSDARLGADALLTKLQDRKMTGTGFRSPEIAKRIADEVPDGKVFPVEANTVDPRAALLELDRIVPKDWDIVCGGAHFCNFAMTHLRGRAAERYHVVNEFGAIGSALSVAIGIATVRKDGKVLLIEGDGSLLMHVQELETVKRHGLRLLTCVINDGGYGAEAHKFRAVGIDPKETIHGRGDLAALARGFGLRGAKVQQLGQFARLFEEHTKAGEAEIWDVHIDDKIPSAQYRRLYFGE